MRCADIIDRIEERYPTSYACEWDNVGLLAGSKEKQVEQIYVALDLTDEVIDEAVSKGADMIVTHHPLIFSPVRRITDEDFNTRRILRLIREDLSYYAMHTNYDVLGMADLAADRIGLVHPEVLEVTHTGIDVIGISAGSMGNSSIGSRTEGIGRVGELPKEMTLRACCEQVKEAFHLEHVQVFGDLDTTIRRAAIAPGSGKSMIGLALEKRADVLITGDIDHHSGIDAVAQGMAVLDAGHYGIEHIFIADMKEFLAKAFPMIQVNSAEIKHPFHMI